MGCFSKVREKTLRFGWLIATIAPLCFVPVASAQQSASQSELLAPDGSLIPDSERSAPQDDVDLFDEPEPQRPATVLEPQDPLNEVYANRSSQALDQGDNQRFNRLLPDPLSQAPHNFRDGRFPQGLLRQGRQDQDQGADADWRSRDDAAFDPLGVPVGSFLFYPELYSRLITTNNLFAGKNNKKSDQALEFTPSFRLRSDWNNHELEVFATGTRTSWRHFSAENTFEYEARVRGRLDITARTSIEGGVRIEQQMEGRGSPELPDAASSPAKTHEAELFGQINHRFNRLGFRLRGQVIANMFDNVALENGTIQNNSLRNYDERALELRSNYEFSPRFSLFADIGVGDRTFEHRVDGDGFLQGSKGWLGAMGARVEFNSNLNFLGRVGYARATPDEASLVDLEGLIYDAALIWTPSRLVTLTLNAETEIEETTQTGSPGSLNRSVSFELVNSWTHRLSSTFTGEYEVRNYAGINQSDKELTLGLGIEYLFARSWVLDTRVEHSSTSGSNSHSEEQFHMGLRWRR